MARAYTFLLWCLVDALAATGAQENIAVVAYEIQEQLQSKLTTPWKLVSADAMSASDRSSALTYVVYGGADLSTALSNMRTLPNGRLCQLTFTGLDLINMSDLPQQFTVCNVHQAGESIAEYVLAAILSWNIQLPQVDAEFRRCTWQGSPSTCTRTPMHKSTKGQTIGIIGLGAIGTEVLVRAAALGMRAVSVTYPLPAEKPAQLAWVGDDSKLPQLMRESDFVVVACPLTSGTKGMVNATILSYMKYTGVLINAARAPIVVEGDLYGALRHGFIGGAVLDVWWNQFAWFNGSLTWPSKYNFSDLPNVWMTPHMSYDTPQAHEEVFEQVARNLDALALGKPLQNVVRNGTGDVSANAAQSENEHTPWDQDFDRDVYVV